VNSIGNFFTESASLLSIDPMNLSRSPTAPVLPVTTIGISRHIVGQLAARYYIQRQVAEMAAVNFDVYLTDAGKPARAANRTAAVYCVIVTSPAFARRSF
jgi:hypothetical protein